MEEKRQRIEERKEKESTTQATTAAEMHENVASASDEDIDGAEAKKSLKIEVHATATHHHEQIEPVVAHAQAHSLVHDQSVSPFRKRLSGQSINVCGLTIIVVASNEVVIIFDCCCAFVDAKMSSRTI